MECEASRSDERNNTAYRFSVNPANPEDPENPTTKATRKTVFLSEDQSLPIGIDKMGTEQITIVADATKLASKSKVYDGEVFHIEGDSEGEDRRRHDTHLQKTSPRRWMQGL